MPVASRVYGTAGVTLAEAWRPGMSAPRGTTVPGFPNLCLVIGPNTGLGHNSLIHIIEAQLGYILDYLAVLDRTGAAARDTRPDAQQRWARGQHQADGILGLDPPAGAPAGTWPPMGGTRRSGPVRSVASARPPGVSA
jgi:hypothetical protein